MSSKSRLVMEDVASDAAENTAPKQRGRPFRLGASGNPKGRPKGARNRATVTAEALLDGEAEAISRKLIEKALEGDTTALQLCLDRILPPRRDRPVAFDLPKIESAAEALSASSAVLASCAAGALSPLEAAEIMGLVSTHMHTLELTEIEVRLTALEKGLKP